MRAIVFSLTLLLSSFLLFLVQPMVGRLLLPSLGGTPAVWNGCMLFFQAVLLGGYAWAHYGPPRLGMRNHLLVHLVLLGLVCFCLPMRMVESWAVPTDSNPIGWLLGQLALCVGLPFFVISSSAPLLQRWFYVSRQKDAAQEPWFLYAISNVGSLVALLSYPFLFERMVGLTDQGWYWTGGFFLLAIMFVACAWYTLRNTDVKTLQRSQSLERSRPLSWAKRFQYIALAAIPSSLMLGVTTVVSTEVGSFPLMWSIPLALYLLTFVLVFARHQVIPHHWFVRGMPVVLLLMPLVSLIDMGHSPAGMIGAHFATFFVVAMVCHGELARRRPQVDQLTEFYLMMSIGGVLGGVVNSLLAPVLFTGILEYPLMLVAACFVIPSWKALAERVRLGTNLVEIEPASSTNRDRQQFRFPGYQLWLGPACLGAALLIVSLVQALLGTGTSALVSLAIFGIPALICYTFVETPKRFALGYAVVALGCPQLMQSRDVVVQHRGFFGVNEVAMTDNQEFRALFNGRTRHGMQRVSQTRDPDPLTYYHRQGPIGDVFAFHGDQQSRVAVVGLGVGTIAAYSQPGQQFDFFEIDPVVVQIAKDQQYFSFLSSAKGDVRIVLGDARIQLDRLRGRTPELTSVRYEPAMASTQDKTKTSQYGVIVLDAFGSDAVPMHLLTVEAIQLYLDMLEEEGLLAIHISSKFIDFQPVGAAIAEYFDLPGAIRLDSPQAGEHDASGRSPSRYLVLSRNKPLIERFLSAGTGWEKLDSPRKLLWTDEHANILDAMMW